MMASSGTPLSLQHYQFWEFLIELKTDKSLHCLLSNFRLQKYGNLARYRKRTSSVKTNSIIVQYIPTNMHFE